MVDTIRKMFRAARYMAGGLGFHGDCSNFAWPLGVYGPVDIRRVKGGAWRECD